MTSETYNCAKCGQEMTITRAVPDVPELVRYSAVRRYGREEIIEKDEHGEYVLHSQATEIIAANDAEIERLKEQNDKFKWQVRDTCTRAEAAEEKNIELEAAWLNAEGKISDLEAKLAQIEKQDEYKRPKKWTDEEVKAGNKGIRWVDDTGVYGRPTDHDVREMILSVPILRGCGCKDCTNLYADPVASDADLRAETIEQCRKAVRNAILHMSPKDRANGDICDDVIARALAALNPSEPKP